MRDRRLLVLAGMADSHARALSRLAVVAAAAAVCGALGWAVGDEEKGDILDHGFATLVYVSGGVAAVVTTLIAIRVRWVAIMVPVGLAAGVVGYTVSPGDYYAVAQIELELDDPPVHVTLTGRCDTRFDTTTVYSLFADDLVGADRFALDFDPVGAGPAVDELQPWDAQLSVLIDWDSAADEPINKRFGAAGVDWFGGWEPSSLYGLVTDAEHRHGEIRMRGGLIGLNTTSGKLSWNCGAFVAY